MKKWGIVLCAMFLGTGCATVSHDPPVRVVKLECWKKAYAGWSKGVEFPVTVIIMTEPSSGSPVGGFRAYGVDPDGQKILFAADGNTREHLWDFLGDPLWGTVVQIEARMLVRAEKEPRSEEQLTGGRLQVAVDLARREYMPVKVTQK